MKEKYETVLKKGMYAIFETSMGDIIVKLFPDKAPMTVENFAALAEGKKEYTDPRDRQKKSEPYYDGTIFHRVIQGFMIQGGDPTGTGRGGPGYQFEDEFSDLRFDQPGYLAMANAGPNTNGSQFFITVAPTPNLNNRHTIFGKVVVGMDIVMDISRVETTTADKPVEPVTIKRLSIERIK